MLWRSAPRRRRSTSCQELHSCDTTIKTCLQLTPLELAYTRAADYDESLLLLLLCLVRPRKETQCHSKDRSISSSTGDSIKSNGASGRSVVVKEIVAATVVERLLEGKLQS